MWHMTEWINEWPKKDRKKEGKKERKKDRKIDRQWWSRDDETIESKNERKGKHHTVTKSQNNKMIKWLNNEVSVDQRRWEIRKKIDEGKGGVEKNYMVEIG